MRQVPPRETRAPRMHPLAVLPVFVSLAGKRVVVAGAGDAAVWKAELAAAAGAHVEVFAPDPCVELVALSQAPPAGSVSIIARQWRADDLVGAALAVGALTGEEAAAFAEAARRHGVPVNIVDTPELSNSASAASSIARLWSSASAPTAPRRSWGKRSVARSKRCCIPRSAPGRRRRSGCVSSSRRGCRWARRAATCGADLRTVRLRHATRRPSETCGTWPSPAPANRGIGRARRRRPRRPRAADAEGPACPAVGRRHPLRPPRQPRDPGAGAPRGAASCWSARPAAAPPAGRDDINRLMVRLRAERQARGAPQGRRPHGVRPRRRGACRLPQRRHRRRGRPRHHGGARRRRGAADPADRPAPHPPRAARHRAHSEAGGVPAHDWPSLADPWTDHRFYMGARTFADMLPKLHRGRARPGDACPCHLRRDNAAQQARCLRRGGSA